MTVIVPTPLAESESPKRVTPEQLAEIKLRKARVENADLRVENAQLIAGMARAALTETILACGLQPGNYSFGEDGTVIQH